MTQLIHEIIFEQAIRTPDFVALCESSREVSYQEFSREIVSGANFFLSAGLTRRERVVTYLEKRVDTVVALFGAAAAGGVFVPGNPLLKPEQVIHILKDCSARILFTTPERLELLRPLLAGCHDLRTLVICGNATPAPLDGLNMLKWSDRTNVPHVNPPVVIDADMVAILYTSGSTGRPKGVVLSHRNLVAGAVSVSQYLDIRADDRILSVLPLAFDYGLNQLTTAFLVGARAVLISYLFPRDVVRAVEKYKITGLAAVPPLWVQLAPLDWPDGVVDHLRYITNSGGSMPTATLATLRSKLPKTKPFLMYGLTEAFRSTYLPPEEADRRPESIGKAIPNAEIMVVREDGTPCSPGEPGELVHRGVHVAMGYWNDTEKTAERYKPAPGQLSGLPITELAVWSGDTVKMDDDGFLYFIGRRDEMIKTSGYRVSPTEVEEVVYAIKLVSEVAAIGVAHPVLGQAVVLVIYVSGENAAAAESVLAECKQKLPAFMVPAQIIVCSEPLPRNPNGKIDRKHLSMVNANLFTESA